MQCSVQSTDRKSVLEVSGTTVKAHIYTMYFSYLSINDAQIDYADTLMQEAKHFSIYQFLNDILGQG